MRNVRPHRISRFQTAPLALAAATSAVLAALAAGYVPAAYAQSAGAAAVAPRAISIAAQPLAQALNELARQADLQMSFPAALVDGKAAPAVSGQLSAQQALDRVLAGSGLQGTVQGSAVVVRAVPVSSGGDKVLPTVSVIASTPVAGSSLPAPYAGGQVARGGRVGMLGNRDMMEMPFSATQYTSQLVEDQQAQTIGDVLVNDPSVRNTYARGAGIEEFNIRGFTLFNYDVSFNGLYGVSPRNASSLIGVERVDVLRGPNALLNGMAPAGSVGGGINLVPKRAGTEPLNRVTLSYADKDQLGAQADIGRRFGQDKEFGVRLNAQKRSGDTPVNGSSERVDALALGLDWQGERVRLEADLNYQERLNHGRSGLLFAPEAGVPIGAAPNNRTNFIPQWSYWKVKERAAIVRGEVDLAPDWVAFGAVGAMKYDFNSLSVTSGVLDAEGNIAARPYRLNEYVNTRSLEMGVRGKLQTGAVRHELVASVSDYDQELGSLRKNGSFYESSIYTPAIIARPDIVLQGAIPKIAETHLRSVALADTISTQDRRVQLTLGARYQQVRTTSFNEVSGAQTDSYDKSAVTPMVAALLKATDAISVYGNFIEGLSQGPTAPAGTANAGQVFAPGKSRQFEVGAKFDAGRFATTVSLFQIERPNSLLDASSTPPTFRMDGRQRNRGLEIISQGEATRGVRLLGGVAYTQGKLTKTEDGVNDGHIAPATSRVQLNVSGEWDTPFLPGLTLTARGLRTSSQYVDVGNTQQLPAWTRIDIGARYRLSTGPMPVTLRASIENVANKNFWQSAAREGLTMGAPRTFLVSVTADF